MFTNLEMLEVLAPMLGKFTVPYALVVFDFATVLFLAVDALFGWAFTKAAFKSWRRLFALTMRKSFKTAKTALQKMNR